MYNSHTVYVRVCQKVYLWEEYKQLKLSNCR